MLGYVDIALVSQLLVLSRLISTQQSVPAQGHTLSGDVPSQSQVHLSFCLLCCFHSLCCCSCCQASAACWGTACSWSFSAAPLHPPPAGVRRPSSSQQQISRQHSAAAAAAEAAVSRPSGVTSGCCLTTHSMACLQPTWFRLGWHQSRGRQPQHDTLCCSRSRVWQVF